MVKKVSLKDKYQGFEYPQCKFENEETKIKEGYKRYDWDYGSNLVRKNTKLGQMLMRCQFEHFDSEVIYIYTPAERKDSCYYFVVMYKKL